MILELAFAPELIPSIESGEKTRTYRLGKKYADFDPGDRLLLINSATEEKIREDATIVEVTKTTFGRIPLDAEGHTSYNSREDMRKKFNLYYEKKIGRRVADTDIFTLIKWQYPKNK
jgi:hypothetical protein